MVHPSTECYNVFSCAGMRGRKQKNAASKALLSGRE